MQLILLYYIYIYLLFIKIIQQKLIIHLVLQQQQQQQPKRHLYIFNFENETPSHKQTLISSFIFKYIYTMLTRK
jgi:hypothetical protein